MLALLSASEKIEQCDNLESVWGIFEQAIKELGFDYFIYLYASSPKDVLYAFANLNLHQNIENPYDPFLHYCCENYSVTKTGASYLPDYPYLPQSATDLIKGAEKLGFKSGLGIPMRLRQSSKFGGFNLGTSLERDAFEEKHLSQVESLRSFCLVTYRRFEELLGNSLDPRGDDTPKPTSIMDQLSPRESEVIGQLALGASRSEIAKNLKISENTVGTHIKNIYIKLDVSSNVDAVRIYISEAVK